MAEKTKPHKHVRVGNVTVTIWKNKSKEDKDFYTATMQRSYRDDKDEWQNTDSLGLGDLPKAIAALTETYNLLAVKVED